MRPSKRICVTRLNAFGRRRTVLARLIPVSKRIKTAQLLLFMTINLFLGPGFRKTEQASAVLLARRVYYPIFFPITNL